jgi:hypothetical protein
MCEESDCDSESDCIESYPHKFSDCRNGRYYQSGKARYELKQMLQTGERIHKDLIDYMGALANPSDYYYKKVECIINKYNDDCEKYYNASENNNDVWDINDE